MPIKTKPKKGSITRKVLINWEKYSTQGEQGFYFVDGQYISSIIELRNTMPNISNETFNHHVQPGNNDFANWIGNVFGLSTLAGKIAKASTKDKLIKLLNREIC